MALSSVAVSGGSAGYTSDYRANIQPVAPEAHPGTTCAVTGQHFVWFFPWNHRRTFCDACGRAVVQAATTTTHPLAPKGMRVCRTCVDIKVPKAAGLTDCAWFHGAISRAEAERRLKQPHSAIGDYLLRVAENGEGGEDDVAYYLSVRGTPRDVRHIALHGSAGEWGLRASESAKTLQQLVAEHHGTDDVIDRVAVIEPEDGVPEPADYFDLSGARVRSKEEDLNKYHAIGRGYLDMDTAA